VSALEPVMRPNGKPYRPRKVIAYGVADEDGVTSGVMVLGTHDVERAQKLADECAAAWVESGYVAVTPERGWYREGFESGELRWLSDKERGRAGVHFREIVEMAPAGLAVTA
jgi:hypothetical protein